MANQLIGYIVALDRNRGFRFGFVRAGSTGGDRFGAGCSMQRKAWAMFESISGKHRAVPHRGTVPFSSRRSARGRDRAGRQFPSLLQRQNCPRSPTCLRSWPRRDHHPRRPTSPASCSEGATRQKPKPTPTPFPTNVARPVPVDRRGDDG